MKQINTAPFSDAKIVESWHKNAASWTVAVREGHIESRRQATDQAIINALLDCSPGSVLDIGCGEGWLVRELGSRHIPAIGIDAISGLIEAAQCSASGDFRVMTYEEIAAGKLDVKADTVVCNFSLLGKESVEDIFRTAASLLRPQGSFIVQTLHPVMACADVPYQDGWREGSWDGFNGSFIDPAPWYFRTIESWIKLFTENKFRVAQVREPIHPKTSKPASMIFIADMGGMPSR